MSSMSKWIAAGAGAAAGAYGAYAAVTWLRYGHPLPPRLDERDGLLDRFIPVYDVVERHQAEVPAPATEAFNVACGMDVNGHPVARALFEGRRLVMGGTRRTRTRAPGLIADARSLGWVVLAEEPGREVVVGAVTKPWEANTTFRSVPPAEFAAFDEADYVKIVWTLRADGLDAATSIVRTETRAVATDAAAREKFRRYWALMSPGIILLRWVMLDTLKASLRRGKAGRALKDAPGHLPRDPA